MSTEELQNLRQKIAVWNEAYARGNPLVSDTAYDVEWRKLRELSPEDPLLYHTSVPRSNQSYDFIHSRPFLSLDKAMSQEDLNIFLTRVQHQTLWISPKLHGVGAVLYDVNTFALLGDGFYGTKLPRGPKLTVPSTYQVEFPTRGEFIILNKDWDPGLGKHPCSTVAGWLTKLANGNLELDNLNRLTFIGFDWFKHSDYVTESAWSLLRDPEACQARLLEYYALWSETYPLDGLVLTVDSPAAHTQYGQTRYYPNWAIAWKPPISLADTTVDRLLWNVSRTGRVVPKAFYAPVELCGTTNTKATANNADWVRSRGLGEGAIITIGKAGEIIPQIVSVKQQAKAVNIPEYCPVCSTVLTTQGLDLICLNEECTGAIIRRLEYFYSPAGVNLHGIGPKFMEDLCSNYSSFARYLALKPWSLLLYGTERLADNKIWSMVLVGKALDFHLLDQLSAYREGIHLARLIQALGIPSIGATASAGVAYFLAHNEFPKGFSLTKKQLTNLASSLKHINNMLADLRPYYKILLPGKDAIKTFSISGTFDLTRDDIIHLLTAAGWVYHNAPTKYTQYFFLGKHKDGKVHKKETLALKHGTPTFGQDVLTSILSEVTPNGSSIEHT